MKVLVTDIDWDTSDTNYDSEDEIELESSMELEIPEVVVEIDDVENYISDTISNVSGFCHNGFSYDIVEPIDIAD